jgi:hypothetical protein
VLGVLAVVLVVAEPPVDEGVPWLVVVTVLSVAALVVDVAGLWPVVAVGVLLAVVWAVPWVPWVLWVALLAPQPATPSAAATARAACLAWRITPSEYR